MNNLSKVGRITKGVTSQPLGVRLAPDEVKEIETLAADQQRSRAWFLRFLILRGLADYKRELASKPTH
ncbi:MULTISPECIES: ribbon-helix-helix protein, CopG family [unclassified Janthinobacterium]|uniref:ribbon-helix-helix protein, CopG family n=1 Tax=unclassified Janthinobacterium TaxID=2610881 RepID=UPI000ACA6933|nr:MULTISPECIES: ribbon-helix-helix protein, CopG family [unclassified Janthinobacterium]